MLALLLIVVLLKVPKDLDSKVPLIPSGYYASGCQQPAGLDVYTWIEQLDLGTFQQGGWDCSQRSAYVEWLLQNCDVDASIAARRGSPSHSWVLVEIDGQWRAFETSDGGYWVSQDHHRLEVKEYFTPDYRVEQVQDWLKVWPGEVKWFLSEWAWW